MSPVRFALVLAALLQVQAAQAEAPAVVVAEATLVSFPVAVEALGDARANESIDVRAQVAEVVTAIHFEEGQRVEAGEVLVELGSGETLSEVAEARANLTDYENQLRRMRQLYETDTAAKSALDQRVSQRDAARAALRAAESRLSHRELRAPFAGRVGLRNVSLGSLVTPDVVITTLDDTDPIKVDFDVPETALARLVPGLDVEVASAAWPGETFRGEVASVDTRVDPVSRTVTVRALLANEDGRLRPGMFLRVSLLKDDVEALVVPEQAIVPEQSRQFVFVVNGEGRVEKRVVRTGRRRPGEVEILEGLVAGETLIAEGTQKVRPGDAVRVVGEIPVGARTEARIP